MTTNYDMLQKTFREQRPALRDAFLHDVLWTLHYDPDPHAGVTLGYENPPHYDVEAKFCKGTDGITSTVRVTDNMDGHPMQTIETRYSLVDGIWKDQVVRNWQR